jgi:amidase
MNPLDMTIKDMQAAFRNGTLTSVELVQFYLKRIATIDHGEVSYNSVFEVNPDALYIAKQKDYEREQGHIPSLMHGIPVLLKDNINTAGPMRTTAGANILKHHYAKEDAEIVKTLKRNGAIILGKTNLTELACFKSFNTVNGFSSLSGYVLCPWDIKEDPSGSSTGSAVSVALQLSPVAIGTETGGSIMSPSMTNGVVGIKPTIGFVSRRGIVPISSTLDTAGPMGKTVTDATILLEAIWNTDPKDPITCAKDPEQVHYQSLLKTGGLKGKKIGIDTTRLEKLSQRRQDAFHGIVKQMKQAGAEIVEDLGITQTKLIYHVMKYEFKHAIEQYLHAEGLRITLEDIVSFNEEDAKSNLKYGQEVLYDVVNHTSGRMIEQEYIDALEERQNAITALNKVFKQHNLDMIYFANYTSLGPHCGYPTMSIPIGLDEKGLPIGTYFLAPHYKESTLIEVGYDLEQLLQIKLDPLKKD